MQQGKEREQGWRRETRKADNSCHGGRERLQGTVRGKTKEDKGMTVGVAGWGSHRRKKEGPEEGRGRGWEGGQEGLVDGGSCRGLVGGWGSGQGS